MPPALHIRHVAKGEARTLRAFLDAHWRPGHALSRSEALLDWLYLDATHGHYHVLAAWDGARIRATLGYLPSRHFDPASSAGHAWLQLWRVEDSLRGTGVGARLVEALDALEAPRSLGVLGMSSAGERAFARLGFRVGALAQAYLVRRDVTAPRLIAGWDGRHDSGARSIGARHFVPLDGPQAMPSALAASRAYLTRRYAGHPCYRYRLYALTDGAPERGEACLVARVVGHRGARALRIVDFLGPDEALCGTRDAWHALLERERCEHADLAHEGIDPAALRAAGFLEREPGSRVVVPSHFEPFEARHVEIRYALRGTLAAGRILRGDSDADRPSVIGARAARAAERSAEGHAS